MPAGATITWAEEAVLTPSRELSERIGLAPYLDARGRLREGSGKLRLAPGAARIAREWAAFTEEKPWTSRLPVSYRHAPATLRMAAARLTGLLGRRTLARRKTFPRWPLDLTADVLADLTNEPNHLAFQRTPVLLSHDIDSPEGLSNLRRWFLAAEEEVGAHSTNYLVPCAWPIDHGIVEEIVVRGHEIGIHGYDHGNRTPFASDHVRWQRLDAARPLIERYRIHGYRAPSLLRTRELLRDLARLYSYDSSIPTSGGVFPVRDSGCASARPFLVEGLAELPISLPRDGSLRFLGYAPREMLQIWVRCALEISRSGGVIVLVTHCEHWFSGNEVMLDVYRQFLEFIAASGRFVWSRPIDVLSQALPNAR